jgi:hypothetical protein
MKYHVPKEYLKQSDLELVTELLFSYPILSQQAKNYINANRFWESGIFETLEGIEYANEKECDYFVLPFKFISSSEKRFIDILELARKNGKKLICLNNDDFGGDYNIPDDVILFRTSFFASTRKKNEFAFPVFIPDIFKYSKGESSNVSVGFCGDSNRPIRKEALAVLKKNEFPLQHDEVFSFYQNPSVDKVKGREKFINNLQNNIFILCPRGCGNFSYRFYETMCFGRIPIFINTDCILPFDNLIDYKNEIVFVEKCELNNLPDKIKEYCKKFELLERQKRCREIWKNYLSPTGFINNLPSLIV